MLFAIPDISSVEGLELWASGTRVTEVKRLDGKELDRSTPRYLVESEPLIDLASIDPSFRVKLSGLGGGCLLV